MTHAVEQHVYAGSAFLPVLGTICGRLGDVALAFGGALCTSHSGYEWRTCHRLRSKAAATLAALPKHCGKASASQQGAYNPQVPQQSLA